MRRTESTRPHVMLIVETSGAPGRDILRGIARYARENGPWAIYAQRRSDDEAVPSWLSRWEGDGIIARVRNPEVAEAVRASGLPAVDVLGVIEGAGLPLVHVDDVAVAESAARHLLERGFRHFGFVGIAGANWSDRRRDAFVAATRAAGFPCSVAEMRRRTDRGMSWERQVDILADWVRRLTLPAGVMAASDQRGPDVLEACRRAGVAVPDEVAVIGVDNDEPLCEVANPPMTSVWPDHRQVGYAAAALLQRLMEGAEAPRQAILLPPRGIVTRLSTDVLAINDRHLATALRFIREHACEGIQVEDVVRQVPLSRSVLQRRFRQALGRTLHDAIVDARLKRAQELLAETDLKIAVISEKAGFSRQEYFGLVFKARLGTTPGAYRRAAHFGGELSIPDPTTAFAS